MYAWAKDCPNGLQLFMSELDPRLKLDLTEVMARDRAERNSGRKPPIETALPPTPTPVSTRIEPELTESKLTESISSVKASLQDTIEKMRVEEQRAYTDKIKHAEVLLQGARNNLASSERELNETSGYGLHGFFSRVTGYRSTLRDQVAKETAWVASCEKQLALLKKQAHGEKDPANQHPALAFYNQGRKLESEGKLSEALTFYRRAAYAIGGSEESRQEAIERSGSGVTAINQTALRSYMSGLQQVNEQLSGVVSSCQNWERGLKMAGTVAVMAPAFVLSIPAGIGVGLIGSLAYGASLFAGQHYTMGRDFKEALREAWGETVDLATMVVKNGLGGALFKVVGFGVGAVLGQGPLRLAGNILYPIIRPLGALRGVFAPVGRACSSVIAACKGSLSALGSKLSSFASGAYTWSGCGKIVSGCRYLSSALRTGCQELYARSGCRAVVSWCGSVFSSCQSKISGVKSACSRGLDWMRSKITFTTDEKSSWIRRVLVGSYNSALGVVAAPFKAAYHIVSLPVRLVSETVKLGWFVVSSPARLFGVKPCSVPFLAQQPVQAAKTIGQFFYKDGSIFRGHIARYFTDILVPAAPRAISTGTSAFITGTAVSGVEEVVRARAFAPSFEDYLKKKYGENGAELYLQFSDRDRAKDREEYQAENRINLRNILYTAGINGATTALAAVIRVKKPTISAADKAALTRASEDARQLASQLSKTPAVAGVAPPVGSPASFPTGTQAYGDYRKAAKDVQTFTDAGVDFYVNRSIKANLGKFDTSPLDKMTEQIKETAKKGRKEVLDFAKSPYAPGKVPRRESVEVPLPKAFEKLSDDATKLSADLASRIPSNAYRNLAATVLPMSAHFYLTSLKNVSDPNLRPGESTYTMQDMMNGVFYTLGGIKFGEGYTAGFNAARSNLPAFRGKPLLPERLPMMKSEDGRALFGNFTSEFATDLVKGATLYAGGRALNAAFPDLLPKAIKLLTGFDPQWFNEEAGKIGDRAFGTYKSFQMQDHKLASVKTKTLNEIFEDIASENGFSLSKGKEKKAPTSRIAGIFLPPAEAEKQAAEIRNEQVSAG